MKTGFLQTSPEFGNIEKNVGAAIRMLSSEKMRGAKLAVLPELFSTGYRFKDTKESLALAEPVSGYTIERLAAEAKKRSMHIVAGFAERDGRRAYNSAALVGPKGPAAVYRKAHLFWHEKKYFSPGNTPFTVHDIGTARVGMMICFDWVFPEAARTLALKGADVICHPSNLVLPYCPEAMITRCLENRVFAITANRVGSESRVKGERLKFIGQSEIVSPRGEVLVRASSTKAEARCVEINPRAARQKSITPVNDLFGDRRMEFYRLK